MQIKEYPHIGESLYCETLENGLEIRIVPKKGFAGRFAAFATNYGGAHRRFSVDGETVDTPAGVAHFLEHKMFDMPSGDNALNVLSANGADPNAFTSSGITCYYFHCTEHFEDNLRLLLHFVSTPYFTDETVQKEQGIIAQEIKMGEDSPAANVYYNLLSLLYEHHPIKDKVAGTVESISEISAKTLYDCHKVFYAPSNMVLCVEGDVDPEEVIAIARDVLSGEKQSVPKADFGEAESLMPVCMEKKINMSVSAPQFLIGAKIKPAEDSLRQRLVSRLALRLLLGSSSPLYTRLYADGTLNRDFEYEIDYSAGTATFIVGGESSEPYKFRDEFFREIERVCSEGFDSARFERAKRASTGARLRGLEDFENVCVSLAFGVFEGYCAFDAPALLNSISKEECESFVRENLVPERMAISIVEAKVD